MHINKACKILNNVQYLYPQFFFLTRQSFLLSNQLIKNSSYSESNSFKR